MIIKFGPLIIGARGTIGGATLSANKSGPYAKAWAKSGDQRSPPQTSQRARIATASQLWRTLTTAQQADWDTYAGLSAQEKTNSLGETYEVSGFAWFVALTNNLLEAGLPPILDAPILTTPGTPIIDSLTFKTTGAASDTEITIDPTSPNLSGVHIVTATVYNSSGRIAGFTNLSNLLVSVPANATPTDQAYTADASSVVGGNVAANANDGDTGTEWVGDPPPADTWYRGTFAADVRLFSYGIFSRNIFGQPSNPKTWTIEAWNGATWDTVDTVADGNLPDFVRTNFTLDDNSKISDEFRIRISDNEGGLIGTSLVEFFFTGVDPAADHILEFQDELETRFGTIQAGQLLFCEVRTQTTEGRRGPGATISATATS